VLAVYSLRRSARWAGLFAALVLTLPVFAANQNPGNPAVNPVPRKDKGWTTRHQYFLAQAKKGDVDLLFLGDSITQGWEGAGKEVWAKTFAAHHHPANFGIGGDRTEHVLWRITEGKELEGINPRAAVLMIGTNNTGSNSAEQIAEGITAIVKELRRQKPDMQILLLGVFPRSAKPTDPARAKIKEINERIAKLDDGKHVHYLDIGPKFLEPDGTLSKDIMPDFLHLSPKGYQIWADAISPSLEKMFGKK
jgi:lysophospholipase L1-like esterase